MGDEEVQVDFSKLDTEERLKHKVRNGISIFLALLLFDSYLLHLFFFLIFFPLSCRTGRREFLRTKSWPRPSHRPSRMMQSSKSLRGKWRISCRTLTPRPRRRALMRRWRLWIMRIRSWRASEWPFLSIVCLCSVFGVCGFVLKIIRRLLGSVFDWLIDWLIDWWPCGLPIDGMSDWLIDWLTYFRFDVWWNHWNGSILSYVCFFSPFSGFVET